MISSATVFARLKHVAPQLRDRCVTHLAVFGSVARGDGTDAGDLDILVKVDLVLEDALKPTHSGILSSLVDGQPIGTPILSGRYF